MSGRTLEILPSSPPYYVELRFPFHPTLKDLVKELPGVKGNAAWNHEAKTWRVPASYLPYLEQMFREEGFDIQENHRMDSLHESLKTHPAPDGLGLHEFQERGVRHLLSAPGQRGILAYVTGAGKTPTAITALATLKPRFVLIVTPAVVKWHWTDELARWWPEHPHCEVIQYGRKRKLSSGVAKARDLSYQAPVQIVSYAMLHEVSPGPWDVIIFDEAHMLIHPSSQQSQAALRLTEANPLAAVWGLTATLAPTEPHNLYGPLNVLQPRAWGKLDKNRKRSFEFMYRYSNGERGEYGWVFEGLNGHHAAELRTRIATCTHRVVEADIRDVLPPITYSVLRCDDKAPKFIAEWVSTQQVDAPHICIFTWHRDTAEAIAAEVGGTCIHGELDGKARVAALEKVRNSEGGVVVATMASIGIGIDLGFCSRVLFAELSGRSEHMIQATGRVAGFRGDGRTQVTFLVARNSADERKAWLLCDRLSQIGGVYETGDAAKTLTTLFDTAKLDEDLRALEFDEELDALDFDFD